ncbi:MAG: aspartate--tRNA ligase [Ruminococcaceae bacterium]|nr:aspartate--tRNA ligase [Oscillospiraceae bacterium]
MQRTGYCATFGANDIGKRVKVCGWVQKMRDLGSLIFMDLRDRSGILQLAFDENTPKEVFDLAFGVRSEYVLSAEGVIRARGEGAVNPNLPTGSIEVAVDRLEVLSEAATPPFEVLNSMDVREEMRLKYRYLNLRHPELQKNIRFRHQLAKSARDYFDTEGFLEIETPILIKSTPEGARDYLVPSRVHPGSFYALPQSPQLYKQLLMVSGFDRYMQIAKCFRDEDLRADRQPEFTQLDLEMSFADEDDVMSVNEGFLKKVFREVLGIDLKTPLPRMPWKEAMENYGSDKPDVRFEMKLCDLSSILAACDFKVFSGAIAAGGSVRAINVKGVADRMSRKEIDKLTDFVKTYRAKGLAWLKGGEEKTSSYAKFLSEEENLAIEKAMNFEKGDVVFIVADASNQVVFDSLGALRCKCGEAYGFYDKKEFALLWVTEFPMFEKDEESGRYKAMHHPFTAPKDEDLALLDTAPEQVRAKAYDIIINGWEVGGGSVRIHRGDIQQRVFDIIGLSDEEAHEKFGFLLEAFRYGVPPHAGLAFGFDRLVSLLLGLDAIRDCIAFPKVQNACELMTDCPAPVPKESLDELQIAVCKEEE